LRQQNKSNARRIRTNAPPPAAPPIIYFLLFDECAAKEPPCINAAVGVDWSVSVDEVTELETSKSGFDMVEEEAGGLGARVVSVPSVWVIVGCGLFSADDGTK
jgi:hypothetical protein